MKWDTKKSIKLSLICTHAIISIVVVLVITMAFTLPYRANNPFGESPLFTQNQVEVGIPILLIASVPALVALFCLRRLLSHIQAEEVFTAKNIRLLRAISWACFAAAVIFFVSFFRCIPLVGLQPSFLVIGIFAGFAGLIMRVVKNVIDAARELKDENDFTI
jgi:hypothetical protein